MPDLSRFTSAEIRAELERREKRRPQKQRDPPQLLTVAGAELETELEVRGGMKERGAQGTRPDAYSR